MPDLQQPERACLHSQKHVASAHKNLATGSCPCTGLQHTCRRQPRRAASAWRMRDAWGGHASAGQQQGAQPLLLLVAAPHVLKLLLQLLLHALTLLAGDLLNVRAFVDL